MTFAPNGLLLLLLAVGVLALAVQPRAAEAQAWRLADSVPLPTWLQIEGSQRTRLETLDGQFRTDTRNSDQILALRSTLRVEAGSSHFGMVAELMDSRQALADPGSPGFVMLASVNSVELLQGHVELRLDTLADGGSRHELRLGRQTINLGSRRLVARNEYRNTANSFTGLYYQNENMDGGLQTAFYVLPMRTEPMDQASLLANSRQMDELSTSLKFWGLHAQATLPSLGASRELYLLGLHESDTDNFPTRNRRLLTAGLRLLRKPTSGNWDFDAELALQFGSQRETVAATDLHDLDHRAWFLHLEAGHSFNIRWQPRVTILYDHASGDHYPSDGKSNRFDTLFGARRFEHGPSGIMGAFARSNIRSPGLSLSLQPAPGSDVLVGYRPYWLASPRDVWTTSGLHDPEGKSGSFVGQQWELRLGHNLWHGNLRLELGGAWLEAGEFMYQAPNATGQGDSRYGYLAMELHF